MQKEPLPLGCCDIFQSRDPPTPTHETFTRLSPIAWSFFRAHRGSPLAQTKGPQLDLIMAVPAELDIALLISA